MLRSECLVALKAYTTLPAPVQGTLERHGNRYQMGASLTNEKNFDRILAKTEGETLCLRRLRVISSGSAEPQEVEGSFVFRGKAVRLDGDIFALSSVVVGTVPEGVRSSSGTYLLRLTDDDFAKCTSPQQVPYGVNTATGDLAPGWNYVSALFDRRVAHAVVACPNGIFVLKTLGVPLVAAKEAEDALRNLRDVEFLAQISMRPRGLYRLSSNCILAAPEGFDISAVQQNLHVPPYPAEGDLTAVGGFLPSRSLLRVDGPKLDYDALRAALPQDATLSRQPLVDWWHASESYEVSVELRLLPGQEVPRTTELKLRAGKNGDAEVRITAKHVPFRELRPGETESMLRGVLLDNLRTAATAAFATDSIVTQSNLNLVSNTLGSQLQKQLPLSEVVAARRADGAVPVDVSILITQAITEGEPVTLPSGERVVVPAYSMESDSPRLAAYLAAFSALGVQGSFQNWRVARSGGVIV
jgi:hypothetical protein